MYSLTALWAVLVKRPPEQPLGQPAALQCEDAPKQLEPTKPKQVQER
jgi:hypothetical protein